MQVLFNILSNEPVTETSKTCRGVFLILNQIPLTIIKENVFMAEMGIIDQNLGVQGSICCESLSPLGKV